VTAPVVDNGGKPYRSTDGQPVTLRYVWELACFHYGTGPEWKLVTWSIDEDAVRFLPFESRQAAQDAFHQEDAPAH